MLGVAIGQTPLYDVRTVEMTKLLLLCGADVNAKTTDGYTPLHEAVNADIAALLIKKNAEINTRDNSRTNTIAYGIS